MLAVIAASAHAQTASTAAATPTTQAAAAPATDQVTSVVITAERRGEENVQNVPEAVDAYSGVALQRLDVMSLQDLSKVDPSLSVVNFGANQQQVIIRGISSSTGQTTGIYVDEAPLEGGFNANILGDNTPGLRLHDIDHIEVLKGPQGTLFGAGSMDGTVRVITNQPNLDHYEGSIEARAADVVGGDGYFDGDAALNVPIVQDKLAMRFVAWGEDGGGFIDQTIGAVTRNNVNDEQLYGGRVEAKWQATDQLSFLGSVNYQNTHVDGSQSWTQYVGPLSSPFAPELGPYPPYQNHSPSQEPYQSDYLLGTLTGQYDLGFGKVIATGTYGHKNELELIDTTPSDCSYFLCAGGPGYPAVFSAQSLFTDYTGEVRFSSDFKGPLQIVVGAYYEQDQLVYSGAVIHADAGGGVAPCDTYAACAGAGLLVNGTAPGFFYGGASPVEFANQDHFSVNQYAFYGQADYKIFENLTATAGIRYFVADLSDFQVTQENIAGPVTTPTGVDQGWIGGQVTTPYVSSSAKATESQPTYNFSLLWEATSDVSLYVRAASGFRIGGINEAATIASQEGISVPASYQPDSLWDYEGGVKAYFMDRRVFVDLSVYHIDWSGQQEDALANGVYNYTLNVGKSAIDGVEASGTVRPVTGLTLSGNVTYVDGRLAANLPAAVVDAGTPGHTGDRLPFVPQWSFSGQAEYEHPLMGDVIGYVQTDFSYRGDSFTAFEPGPSDFYTELPSYFLLDLKAGVRLDRYDVSVYADNVTNTAAFIGVKAALDAVRIYSPRPLTVGVRVSAHL